jgi:hypothetical protein
MIASLNVCIEAMQGAALSRRKALLIELSVGLTVFCSAGNTDKPAMTTLTEIYASAGYDCLRRDGKDYQTVHRRSGASALLFEKLTMPLVVKWAGEKKNVAAINEIATQLNILNFFSIDDVLAYCGKARAKPVPIAPAVPRHDHIFHIKTEHLKFDIPDNVGANEIMDLARKLLALADRITKKAAQGRWPAIHRGPVGYFGFTARPRHPIIA